MTGPIKAKDIRSRKVEWLWKERIPRGMMTIVGGRPDQGKGLFCAHLAAEVSNMKIEDPRTGRVRRANVLYSAAEDDSAVMTKPRLEAAGADLGHIDLWRFRLPAQIDELEAWLTKGRIDLLIVDPLAAHLSGGVSRHSDNIRTVLNPLTDLIEETRTAVVIVEHVLKRIPQSGHPLAAIGGSGSGLVAASRMAYLFGADPSDSDKRYLCAVKHNICEKPTEVAFNVDTVDLDIGEIAMLSYEGETAFSPMNFLVHDTRRKMGRPADKKAAAAEWLTKTLWRAHRKTGKGILAKDLYEDAKQYMINAKTLRSSASDIEVVRTPSGGGPKVVWTLPEEVIDLLTDEESQRKSTPKKKRRLDPRLKGQPKGGESSPFMDARGDIDEGEMLTDADIAKLLGSQGKEDA
jgi:hypothetical protein